MESRHQDLHPSEPACGGALPAGVARAVPAAPRSGVLLYVNGLACRLSLDPRATLLDVLRDELGLIGSKNGCDLGQCGACTVLVGRRRVLSCLTLAVAVREPVTTIEGLAHGDRLHPVQAAFIQQEALHCGFCTPGQIMSAVGLMGEGCPGDPQAVREAMSGNLCRCGAYPGIVAAVLAAARGQA